ncbi:aromatic hydrocarbon degradation protein, partial [Ferruginibacter sp. HRS2-29]|nr:aromatic hydrocarbon degradation protein [Ferruginibacter sp. HRS2-29]MCP9751098.1 aromatic hydrocarbon degradation protein [Ferruginibacter sp. HRS2-29]
PSFIWAQDERTTTLHTDIEGPSGNVTQYDVSSEIFTNGQPGKSKYLQMSPWKAMLSASYVFRETENVTRQKGFLTADVEYVNHKGTRFSDNNKESSSLSKDYKKQLNEVIKDAYKGAFNFRVGGELKFNIIMARLGFAYYGDPYRDVPFKASKMLASGGLGYRNKGFFIDLTYVQHLTKDANMPYVLSGQDNTFATTRVQQSNVVATLGWKF